LLPFDSATVSQGIAYDGVNTFTLSAAGVYQVNFGVTDAKVTTGGGASDAWLVLLLNGVGIDGGLLELINSNTSGLFNQVSLSVLFMAGVGDTLNVTNDSGETIQLGLGAGGPQGPSAYITIVQIA
jgi:hypothetical protein